jgi:hypothetical protein
MAHMQTVAIAVGGILLILISASVQTLLFVALTGLRRITVSHGIPGIVPSTPKVSFGAAPVLACLDADSPCGALSLRDRVGKPAAVMRAGN